MDKRTKKRIDSLYRNIKSFDVLMILSIFVPLLLLFAVPLSFAYLYLRRRLLRDINSGRIELAPLVNAPASRNGEVSLLDKIDFIGSHDTRLWVPVFVTVAVGAIVATLLATS